VGASARRTKRALAAYFALQRRAAEVVTIREHVTELLARDEHVVVLGDFNDVTDAATTQMLYGPAGSQPRGPSDLVDARSAFQQLDEGDQQRLFNVTMLAPETDRWSRITHGKRELIDHILASAGLMTPINKLRAAPTVEIRNASMVCGRGQPRAAEVEPDHAAVTATFAV
jgi:predicted extracellular nuclease